MVFGHAKLLNVYENLFFKIVSSCRFPGLLRALMSADDEKPCSSFVP